MLRLILLLFPVFIMSACSGDGDRVVVEGLGYNTGTYSGTTDSRGQYLSAEDDTDVVFSLGGTEIATLPATGTVTVTDLISVDRFPDSLGELLPAYTSNEANELHQAVNTVGLLALFDNNNDLTDGIDLRDWDKRLQPLSLDLNVSAREFFISRLGEVAQLAGFDPLSDIPEPSALLYSLYKAMNKKVSAYLASADETTNEDGEQTSGVIYSYSENGFLEFLDSYEGRDYSLIYSDNATLTGLSKIENGTDTEILELDLSETGEVTSVTTTGTELYDLGDVSYFVRDWVGYSEPIFDFGLWRPLDDYSQSLTFVYDGDGRRVGLTQNYQFTDDTEHSSAHWEQEIFRDSLGRVTSSEAYFYVDGSATYERSLIKSTVYAENGLVSELLKTYRTYSEGILVQEWFEEFELNDQGRMIRRTTREDLNEDGISEITYEYRRNFNANGQITSYSYGAPDNRHTATYLYDEDNRLILEESGNTATEYTYDEMGHLSRVYETSPSLERTEVYVEGELSSIISNYSGQVNTSLYRRTESNGQLISSHERTTVSPAGMLLRRSLETEVRDLEGRLLSSQDENDSNGDGLFDNGTSFEYSYTPAGKVATVIYSGYDNRNEVEDFNYITTYDYARYDDVTDSIPLIALGLSSRNYPLNHWSDYIGLFPGLFVQAGMSNRVCPPGINCLYWE